MKNFVLKPLFLLLGFLFTISFFSYTQTSYATHGTHSCIQGANGVGCAPDDATGETKLMMPDTVHCVLESTVVARAHTCADQAPAGRYTVPCNTTYATNCLLKPDNRSLCESTLKRVFNFADNYCENTCISEDANGDGVNDLQILIDINGTGWGPTKGKCESVLCPDGQYYLGVDNGYPVCGDINLAYMTYKMFNKAISELGLDRTTIETEVFNFFKDRSVKSLSEAIIALEALLDGLQGGKWNDGAAAGSIFYAAGDVDVEPTGGKKIYNYDYTYGYVFSPPLGIVACSCDGSDTAYACDYPFFLSASDTASSCYDATQSGGGGPSRRDYRVYALIPSIMNVDATNAQVGIFTQSPRTPLDVRGSVRFGIPPVSETIGANSFAAGDGSYASGDNAVAIGNANNAQGYTSTALGFWSWATGYISTGMGYQARAQGDYSTAIGYWAQASGDQSISLSTGSSTASGPYSVVIGQGNTATNQSAVAIGWQAHATADYATAIGYDLTAGGAYSVALGRSTSTSQPEATAMGYDTHADGRASTAMGRLMTVSGNNSVGIGMHATESYTVADASTMAIMGGEVGIGTESPQALLHVAGDIQIDGNCIGDGCGGGSLWADEGGGNISYEGDSVFIDGSGNSHGIVWGKALTVDGNSGQDIVQFRDSGANIRFRQTSGGSVGIGIGISGAPTPIPGEVMRVQGNVTIDGDLNVTGSGGGSTYTLPAATTSVLGGVIVGNGLDVEVDGTISVHGYPEGQGGYEFLLDGFPGDAVCAANGYLCFDVSDSSGNWGYDCSVDTPSGGRALCSEEGMVVFIDGWQETGHETCAVDANLFCTDATDGSSIVWEDLIAQCSVQYSYNAYAKCFPHPDGWSAYQSTVYGGEFSPAVCGVQGKNCEGGSDDANYVSGTIYGCDDNNSHEYAFCSDPDPGTIVAYENMQYGEETDGNAVCTSWTGGDCVSVYGHNVGYNINEPWSLRSCGEVPSFNGSQSQAWWVVTCTDPNVDSGVTQAEYDALEGRVTALEAGGGGGGAAPLVTYGVSWSSQSTGGYQCATQLGKGCIVNCTTLMYNGGATCSDNVGVSWSSQSTGGYQCASQLGRGCTTNCETLMYNGGSECGEAIGVSWSSQSTGGYQCVNQLGKGCVSNCETLMYNGGAACTETTGVSWSSQSTGGYECATQLGKGCVTNCETLMYNGGAACTP